MKAHLIRILPPQDERFPHDLLLYPTDKPTPEYWETVWVRIGIYAQFFEEWDRKTCPACQTLTIKQTPETKYTGELSSSPYSSTAFYDKFTIYRCANCHCGWTERTGSESFVDTSFP